MTLPPPAHLHTQQLTVTHNTHNTHRYDTMQYVRSPTATVGYGMCLGMGGFLLACGGEKVGRHRHTAGCLHRWACGERVTE